MTDDDVNSSTYDLTKRNSRDPSDLPFCLRINTSSNFDLQHMNDTPSGHGVTRWSRDTKQFDSDPDNALCDNASRTHSKTRACGSGSGNSRRLNNPFGQAPGLFGAKQILSRVLF